MLSHSSKSFKQAFPLNRYRLYHLQVPGNRSVDVQKLWRKAYKRVDFIAVLFISPQKPVWLAGSESIGDVGENPM